MFDIGFPELIVVLLVSLLVIGPERLPETVRSISLWIGRLKRNLYDIKTEIESEIGADEIRQQLHNEKIMSDFEKTKSDLNEGIQNLNKEINSDTTNKSGNP